MSDENTQLGGSWEAALEKLQLEAMELVRSCQETVGQAENQGVRSPALQDLMRMALFSAHAIAEEVEAGSSLSSDVGSALLKSRNRLLAQSIDRASSLLCSGSGLRCS